MPIAKVRTSRRKFLIAAAPAIASGLALPGIAREAFAGTPGAAKDKAGAANEKIWSSDYWAQKGDVKLYMFRKRMGAPQAGKPALPVLFLIHGSSTSSRPSYDLTVPGHGEYSVMDKFAEYGYDVWTMDCENYGRSSRTEGNANIADGVEDLKAGSDLIVRETGKQRLHFFGESSGALRAGAFAMVRPERVDRMILSAFTYTGEGSPTLADRGKQVEFYRTHNRRPRDRDMIRSIFTRDKPGTSEPAVGEAMADAELPFGNDIPTGTYLDMTANLPVVDPLKVHAPVMILRGEFDGIATEQDVLNFFQKLPNADRQFVVLPGIAHSVVLGINRQLSWHAMRAFLETPPRLDGGQAG
jgi:pimeloyl-ACP methyl ester carboxylesterase